MAEDTQPCQITNKYRLIECQHSALPGDPEGLCILHSQDTNKDQKAFLDAILDIWNMKDSKSYDFSCVFFPGDFDPQVFFGSREFPKPVDFSGATFMKEAKFSGATFTGKASFLKASFTKNANFSGATFNDQAVFYRATFKERANFLWARFTKDADFSEASFKKEADFSRATFTERADFFEATFKEEAVFSEATFTQKADFSRATIAGRVFFRKINPEKEGEPPLPFRGDFRDLQFQDKGLLRFQDLSLAQVGFAGTDLRRVEIHHIAWQDYRGRKALYDEVLLRQGVSIPTADKYADVERLYRNLEVNYESENDYKTSGDFHYGEMEMYRRSSKWRWFPFYWYNLYWALSGYGERPFQALCWLAGLLVLLPLLIWLLGLDISSQGNIPGFWKTFSYMFEKATFQKPELKEINDLGKFISNLGMLIIPGQAALFLLALRNRLGRRR